MSTFPYTDTHCHLDFHQFDNDRETVITRAIDSGLEKILTVGIDLSSSVNAVHLSERFPNVYCSVGVHPNSGTSWSRTTYDQLKILAGKEKVVAIGEIGLDYYRDHTPQDVQRKVFASCLELAGEVAKPIIVHTRNTSSDDRSCILDTLDIAEDWITRILSMSGSIDAARRGVFHSFSGNKNEARKALDMGFFIGISGPVTFKNADNLREVVEYIPLDRLLIETDAPFLTPHPHRGTRNEPSNVIHITDKIAEVKNLPVDKIVEATYLNSNRLFRWSKST